MKIISLVNSKGGVGKTTLCVNLAREMLLHLNAKNEKDKDAKILLVDADPQGSLRDWHEAGGHKLFELIALDRKKALLDLPIIALHFDYVFVDTPGKGSDIISAAIVLSDLVLVPVQPSYYDIWAALEIVNLIKQRQAITSDVQPKGAFLLNRCIPNTLISKDAKDFLNKSAFPFLHSEIHQRVAFAETTAKGQTVFETNNANAIDSIVLIGKQIREVLGNDI